MNSLFKLNLSNKLTWLVTLSIIIVSTTLGFYFDNFLKDSFLKQNKQSIANGFFRLSYKLNDIETKLKHSAIITSKDIKLNASIDLINNYQDKNNYNPYLIDEEKKTIARYLLELIKLSLDSEVALYDMHGELISFVIKDKSHFNLGYISYDNNQQTIYTRLESDYEYHSIESINSKNISLHSSKNFNVQIAHINYSQSPGFLTISSAVRFKSLDANKTSGYLNIHRPLNLFYFSNLGKELGLIISAAQIESHLIGINLNTISSISDFEVQQSKDFYKSTAFISTQKKPFYISVSIDKSRINQLLSTNRQQLMVILILTSLIILAISRYLIYRKLSLPLSKLMKQIDQIKHQQYTPSLSIKTNDELETISDNINILSNTVAQRESSLKKSQSELEYLSHHDSLTNLSNRRFFMQRLHHALTLAERNQTQLALFFIDLDQFKDINDTLGHNVGDELLVKVSQRLTLELRNTDTLARIGGDEFMIFIENTNGINDIENLISKLIKLFKEPFHLKEVTISTSCSIGVTLYPQDGQDTTTLIKNADLAMYKVKELGRNGYQFYSEELSNLIKIRSKMIKAINMGLLKDEFEVYYQAKVSTSTGLIHSIEALVRWNSQSLGFQRPDQFIPLAEETGQIIPLGEWVFKKACRDFKYLLDNGFILDHVAINVSSIQLRKENFLSKITNIIKQYHIDCKNIEIEITESFIATDVDAALNTLNSLHEQGFSLAIDDFGTGYSSLAYLKKLAISRIKIDKSFVDDLPSNLENVAIVKSIIALAKAFGLQITAEGVETEKQNKYLKKLGCDEIQGYLYVKPMPLADFIDFYHNFNAQNTIKQTN